MPAPVRRAARPQLPAARPPRRDRVPVPGGIGLTDVVGIGHVVAGALALGSGLFALVFGAESAPVTALVSGAVLLVVGAGSALAGLWLRDGRRRGAALAAPLDVLRVAVALVAGDAFGIAVAVLLLAGLVAVWPTLGATAVARRRG